MRVDCRTLVALVLGTPLAWCETSHKPHILFIVADDLGWNDVGFRSHQIRTPNIDALALDGLILNQYYVHAVCSPSRATFLTGRYSLHHTVVDYLKPGAPTSLPLNETLLPQLLSRAGYRSHAIGKWHLGFHKWAHTPTFRGFESFVGYYGGSEDYFDHRKAGAYDMRRDMGPSCGPNCSQVAWELQGRYSTQVFTERAIEVINAHDIVGGPLFMYLAYQAVHDPAQVPESYVQPYRTTIETHRRQVFAGMLSCMDEGIGNITEALEARGMLADALIIFTSDNGGPIVSGDAIGSTNYPLRGGKHSLWEGGTRATALVWAGERTGLEVQTRGSKTDELMHGADWLPTLCGVAGVGDACERLPLDGVDQGATLFLGEATTRTEVFYGQHDFGANLHQPYDTALRDGDGWKLFQDSPGQPSCYSPSLASTNPSCKLGLETHVSCGGPKLFNVREDPGEHQQVAALHPEIVARLSARLEELRKSGVDVVGGGSHPDPSCPAYNSSKHQHPRVGNVWEPWCDEPSDVVVV